VLGIQKSTKKQVAVKIIKKTKLTKQQINAIRDEIQVYSCAQHLNVVKLEDSFETFDRFYLVFELHSTTHLEKYIESVKDQLDEPMVRDFIMKIAQTVNYLHDMGVFVRNLDLRSFLMSETTKDGQLQGALPRLSRLDAAKVMGIGTGEYCLDITGDLRFQAPEVIQGKPYDFKADSWSFGIMLYFILTLQLPFDDKKTFNHATYSSNMEEHKETEDTLGSHASIQRAKEALKSGIHS